MTDFYQLTSPLRAERLADLARHALTAWPLEAREIRLIKCRENAVFRLVTGDGRECALRVHRAGYHTDQELRSELAWMEALIADGFDVPEPIPTAAGDLFTIASHEDVPEPRQVDLFRWVEGRSADTEGALTGDLPSLELTFHTLGVVAARLHNQSSRWTPPADFTRPAWDTDGLVGEQPLWGRFWELGALTGAQRELIERARSAVREDLSRLERTRRNYGLIHADMLSENLIVNGSTVHLIDFDDAGYGWHMFEIATALYSRLGQPYHGSIERAMLAGYRSERELTAADEALLPLFYAARGLTYLGWIQTRQETEHARDLTPVAIELCCGACTHYLDIRRTIGIAGG